MSEAAYEADDVPPVPFGHGRFLQLRPLNAGGMGALSITYDTKRRTLGVLKRMAPEKRSDAQAIARFQDEINIAFRFTHPNLVAAIDWGEVDGETWLLLEWIAGQNGAAVVQRAAALDRFVPLRIAAGVIAQLCHALEYAHERLGFVHRDISTANVVIGYDGIARLVDYGLALSSVKSSRTIQGYVPGTEGFIAPERINGEADRRSDLFALAAVAWNVMTSAPLLSQGEDDATKKDLCERFRRFRKEAPPTLPDFLWTALHREPARRFQTASAMRAALQQSLGTPIATDAEIAHYVDDLFKQEKKETAAELKRWRELYDLQPPTGDLAPTLLPGGVASAPVKTAVLPRVAHDDAQPATRRDTMVIGARRSSRALWLAVAGVAAASLAIIVIALRADGGRSRLPVPAPKPIAAPPAPQPHVEQLAPPVVPPAVVPPAPQVGPVTPKTSSRKTEAPKTRPVRPAPQPVAVPVAVTAPAASSIDERIERANDLVRDGQIGSARELLSELAREPGARARALVATAKLEWHQGAYEDAIRVASAAERAGGGIEAVSVRAFAEFNARQYDAAVRDFRRVLSVKPEDSDARLALTAAEQQLRKAHSNDRD